MTLTFRLDPTPGRSTSCFTPAALNMSVLPMPDLSRIGPLASDPAHKMTLLAAYTLNDSGDSELPLKRANDTPFAVMLSSNSILATLWVANTVRKSRCWSVAQRRPSAADERRFLPVTGSYQIVHEVDAETTEVLLDRSFPMARPWKASGSACLYNATAPGMRIGVYSSQSTSMRL